MSYAIGLSNDADETCTNCNAKAVAIHESVSGRMFPKCEKHLEDVLAAERRFAAITPWSGANEYGEYYDEDSY